MTAKSMERAWTKAQLVFQSCAVVALTVLDVRDLNYKLNWPGPYISYRFAAVGANVLQPVNLQLAVNMTTSGMLLRRPNGWSSFFEKCENLSPVARAKTFRSLMGHNCTVGTQDHNVTYAQLIMAGSVRMDSVAWVCCQLLEPNRHPPVCNSNLVRDFEERYFVESVPVPGTWVAEAGSIEEAELLGLLDVIGVSTPLS